jgi:hypothetical protein
MSTPSTEWKEQIDPGEAERFEKYGEQFRAMQRERAKGGAPARALHIKQHVAVEAELEVLGDLPEHARVGFFARPAKYRAYVRFSSGSGVHQGDRTADVRGVAIKVFGVPGKKVIPGLEDAQTQDFSCNHVTGGPFRNADEFVALVMAARGSQALILPRLIGAVGFGRAVAIIRGMLRSMGGAFPTFAARPYYGLVPIRMGDYAGRYALLPRGTTSAEPVAVAGKPTLRAELGERLRREALAWDLVVQFFVDEERTPIEDPSVEWKESDSPYVTVARLSIPVQDVDSEHGQKLAAYAERLSFDPWHALVEHRPLGNMQRARSYAYKHSTIERGAISELEVRPL